VTGGAEECAARCEA
jgi:hypothetical protein